MPDWLFWLMIPLLLALVGVFLYLRNKRPSDDD
jgi:LPXTG-motif cell wall-anchored protein